MATRDIATHALDVAAPPALLMMYHIPKTGGSSVREWLLRNAGKLMPPSTNRRFTGVLRYYEARCFICRHYAQRLMASENKQDIEQVRQMDTLTRAQRFRTNMGFLTEQAAMGRKSYYAAKKTGVLAQKQKASAAANPAMNPNGMMDMMKNNMSYMIPNIAMMSLVNMFFEGFLIVKVPFALTPRFKMMLQQGIDLKSLSASYVSSLSWYFIVMFGINEQYLLKSAL